jgi:hypothetical protein
MMKAQWTLAVFLALAPAVCNAQQDEVLRAIADARDEAQKAIGATASSTADPSEHQQQLAAARLRMIQAEAGTKKEIDRLNVASASVQNGIEAAKLQLNTVSVTGVGVVASFTVEQFDSAITANKNRLIELQQQPDSPEKSNAQSVAQRAIVDLEGAKGIRVQIGKGEQTILENREKSAHYEAALGNLENDLVRADDAIQRILRTSKELSVFTTIATAIFALLVGFVIAGFFVIAGRSESVRTAIFTGDAGIQFVTLFSVVIAIILFGILRILDGKELSALLGGLSGFILGKATTRVPGTPTPPGAPEPAPPPPAGGQV